ncbi:MAG: GCN5-related N-acetyltransferase [Acidimicrobiales bacterium]|nr:GCN5-related N-acetyltransferase [Acidimicrobiales bacterium]
MEVRRAVLGDEEALRSLRVAAMTDAPGEFGSTLERELARPLEDWSRFLTTSAMFFVERDGTPVGLAGGHPSDDDIELVSMWVAPDARGLGGGDALVQAVLAWAGDAPVRLYVVEGNERARRLYERNGFRPTGETSVRERDGVVELVFST